MTGRQKPDIEARIEYGGSPNSGGRGAAALTWSTMDEGLPIAYDVLDDGVAVYSSDGELVGTVEHVLAAPELDIFHGIVLRAAAGSRFVEADQIASLHERGVDLRIDAAATAALPEPQDAASGRPVRSQDAKPSRWRHIFDELEGLAPGRRDSTKRD